MQLFKNLFAKPLFCTLHVTTSSGFHLRPIARFVTLAKTFSSRIDASFEGKSVDAKKVNTLLLLSLEQGDTFTLKIQGKDAKEAKKALQELFDTLMEEEREKTEEISYNTHRYEATMIEGESLFQGVEVAPLWHYQTQTKKRQTSHTFAEALTLTLTQLDVAYKEATSPTQAEIFLAQKSLLETLAEESDSLEAFQAQIEKESYHLEGSTLESKRADYEDLLHQLQRNLGEERTLLLPDSPHILVAKSLLPSEIALIKESPIVGVVLHDTSPYAHSAILLRASGVPSIIAPLHEVTKEEMLLLDSLAGVVVKSPTPKDIASAHKRASLHQQQSQHANDTRFELAQTTQGKTIEVFANIGNIESAKEAKEAGANGVGLLRSEFLFQLHEPSLEKQRLAYQEIFEMFESVTVRTLDVGGDKSLPYLHIPPEENPFLGIRGVRLFRTHPEVLKRQLHAIFLARGTKRIKVMFPMVSTLEEFTQAKAVALKVAKEQKLSLEGVEFGIMIEVPSVLFLLDAFNEVVDFYSIGTNDLSQYLFATERTHPLLKIDPLSFVLFDALRHIMKYATKPVSLCGELAANPNALKPLLEMGIERLSVSPKSIAMLKEEIRHV